MPRVLLLTATQNLDLPDGFFRLLRMLTPLTKIKNMLDSEYLKNNLPIGTEMAELVTGTHYDGIQHILDLFHYHGHHISYYNPSRDPRYFPRKVYTIKGSDPAKPGLDIRNREVYDCRGGTHCRVSFNEYTYTAIQPCMKLGDEKEKYACMERVQLDSRLPPTNKKGRNTDIIQVGEQSLTVNENKYKPEVIREKASMIYAVLDNIEQIDKKNGDKTRKHFIYVNADSKKDPDMITSVVAGMLAWDNETKHKYKVIRPTLKYSSNHCKPPFTGGDQWGYTSSRGHCFAVENEKNLKRGSTYKDRRNVVIMAGQSISEKKYGYTKHNLHYRKDISMKNYTVQGGTVFNPEQKVNELKLKTVNHRENNKYGEQIRFVVADKNFQTGMDLFDMQDIHIIGIPENRTKLVQVIGRIVRFFGMSPEFWETDADGMTNGAKVNVYIYSMCTTEDCLYRVQDRKGNFIRFLFEDMVELIPYLTEGGVPAKTDGRHYCQNEKRDPLENISTNTRKQYQLKWNIIKSKMEEKAKRVSLTYELFKPMNEFLPQGQYMDTDEFIAVHLGLID
jgi:hypothetical protein